jgi:hypothetical protein
MKEFKISCPHCQQHIAFPEKNVGQVIACPACGLSVGLNVPGYAPQKKSHGVFYYVFWGVVSLIATGFILTGIWVIFLGGLVAVPAFEQARKSEMARLASARTNAPTASVDDPATVEQKQKSAYLPKIELTKLFAIHHDTYEGKKVGVEFKLKNNGEQTLNRVEVTVYFLDRDKRPVYDEKFYPISVSEFSKDTPLRPGYSWQLEPDHFIPVSRALPDEWYPGLVSAKVTDIEFAK